MTVYIDDMRQNATVGRLTARWSHLFSDTSEEELDKFAAELGMKLEWKQLHGGHYYFPHYDVTDTYRAKAIALGARPCAYRDLPGILENANIRRREAT